MGEEEGKNEVHLDHELQVIPGSWLHRLHHWQKLPAMIRTLKK